MTVRRQSLTKQIIEIAVKMSIGNEAWVLSFLPTVHTPIVSHNVTLVRDL